MIRFYSKLITLLIVTVGLFVLSSCDDDDSDSNPLNSQLVGSWELLKEDGEVVDYILIITFQPDGRFTEFYDDDFFTETSTGTYTFLSETKVRISYGDLDVEVMTILSITPSRLIVLDDDDYAYELIKL